MKVLVACPVSNREWILPYYLEQVHNLIFPKQNMVLYFLVNNSTDNSQKILELYKNTQIHNYANIQIEVVNDSTVPKDMRVKSVRREHTYHWLAALRNRILQKCVEFDCDYVLSCDSDILMRPDTLLRLVEHKEHIVSSLVYNGYLHRPDGVPSDYSPIENAWRFPNILLHDKEKDIYVHQANRRVKLPNENPPGYLLPTHFTGACILISKEVASKVRYGYYRRGEDEFFCREARKASYNIFCDVSLFNCHIMSERLLQLWLDSLLPNQ